MGTGRWHAALCYSSASAVGGFGLQARATDDAFAVANPKYNALYQRTGTYYTHGVACHYVDQVESFRERAADPATWRDKTPGP